jgi:DNA-directed RNA polymerase specialized sigma24 family protein
MNRATKARQINLLAKFANDAATERGPCEAPAPTPGVLLMHAREGYKYDEIAERLNVSIHQVERYLASAKQELMVIDWGWD